MMQSWIYTYFVNTDLNQLDLHLFRKYRLESYDAELNLHIVIVWEEDKMKWVSILKGLYLIYLNIYYYKIK